MITELWKQRYRPPLLSRGWLKAWAKRLLLARHFFGQALAHARLRRLGAKVAATAYFSDANMIQGGALTELVVGEESFIGRAELAAHGMIFIGSRVCINDGARILTATHDVEDPFWRSIVRPVKIEDHVWIATDAIVLPGVTIGHGAVVGAAAVVTKNVPAGAVVAGNPAHLLPRQRASVLDYSPVRCLALYDAWLGPRIDLQKTAPSTSLP